MDFKENQTIKRTTTETFSDKLKKKPNIFLYVVYALAAMFVGEIIFGVIQVFIFGVDNVLKDSLRMRDIYTIVSLIGELLPIGCLFFVAKKFLNRSKFSLGIRKENSLKDYFLGIILSLLQISAIVGLGVLFNSTKLSLNSDIKINYFILFTIGWMIQGFCEELLCRSLLMNGFAAFTSVKKGMILNALIFSLLHLGNNNVNFIALLNLFLSGVSYSLIFYLTDSIWMAASAHSFWNMFQANLYGISVSGLPLVKTKIFKTSFTGSKLITGGSFGIEASLFCTLVELIVIIYFYMRIKKKGLIIGKENKNKA